MTNNIAENVKIATKIEKILKDNVFSTLDEIKEIMTKELLKDTIVKELNINEEDIELKYDQNKNLIISVGDSIETIMTSITIEAKEA